MYLLRRVRNKIMYVRNSGYKHQNNPLVSAETVRHSSTYIILNIMHSGDPFLWSPRRLQLTLYIIIFIYALVNYAKSY